MREGQGKAAQRGQVRFGSDSTSASPTAHAKAGKGRRGRGKEGRGAARDSRRWSCAAGKVRMGSGRGAAGKVRLRPDIVAASASIRAQGKERGRDDRRDRPVSERERGMAACWACLATGPRSRAVGQRPGEKGGERGPGRRLKWAEREGEKEREDKGTFPGLFVV